MRTIKFRAWDKLTSGWVQFNQPPKHVTGRSTSKTLVIRGSDENVVFQQFTGLLDNNDKEVYEGDIVYHEDGEFSWHGIVKWDEHELFFYADLWETNETLQTEFAEAALQILGNIYENPELINLTYETDTTHTR